MQEKLPVSRVHDFVESKSAATSFYIENMLAGLLPFSELEIFLWDTLEEWNQLDIDSHYVSEQEQVLWHLFHIIKRWPESTLRSNVFLRQQLTQGALFLKQQGPMLVSCNGIRP